MKRTPRENKTIANMRPGALCRDGFFGDDARGLAEIIAADDAEVIAMGLTHAQLAEALERALAAAMAAYGAPVSIGEHLSAVYREAMGRISCPWGHWGLYPKGRVEVTDARGETTLIFTPLSVHLIAEHGFYQGRGARYRIEPSDVALMFGLASQP